MHGRYRGGCRDRAGQEGVRKMKILAIRFGRVGDVVLVWKAATAAAAEGHHLTLLTDSRIAPLFEGDPVFSRVIGWDRAGWKRSMLKGLPRFVGAAWRLRAESWEAVADFQGFTETRLLAQWVRARERVLRRDVLGPTPKGTPDGKGTSPLGGVHHDVEDHLALWRVLGISSPMAERPIQLAPIVTQWAEEFWQRTGLKGQKVLVVNPGASAPYKQWSPSHLGRAVEAICRHQIMIPLIVWGPGERHLAEEVKFHLVESAVMAGETTLPQLAGLLQRGTLMVTNDSGPMHLGAVMGIPVVAVFFKEHSRPEVSGPLGHGHRVWWVSKAESDQWERVVELAGDVLSE